jgi:hypothetical protein
MKRSFTLVAALLASFAAQANSTCYQAIDPTGVTFYRSYEAPVDLSMKLGDAIAKKYPAGTHIVMSESAKCPPLDIAPNYLTRVSATAADAKAAKSKPQASKKKRKAKAKKA